MVHPSLDEIYRLFRKGLEKVHSDHVYKFKDYAECIFDTYSAKICAIHIYFCRMYFSFSLKYVCGGSTLIVVSLI